MSVSYNNVTIVDRLLKVIQGQSFTLRCFASSNPAISITWLGLSNQTGDILSIENVEKDIHNNITCLAVNTLVDSLGNSLTKSENFTLLIDVMCK